MASITEKPSLFLVRWRDENGGTKSFGFMYGRGDGTARDEITREQALAQAEAINAEKRREERRAAGPREFQRRFPDFKPDFIGLGDDTMSTAFRTTCRRSSSGTTSETHRRRPTSTHSATTSRARRSGGTTSTTSTRRTSKRSGTVSTLESGRRNVGQLLRKGFARAVRRGFIDVNPLTRADISIPSKKTRVSGPISVLEPDELGALVDAAASKPDRCIVLVMGYGGLRGGEVRGLTRRDIVRRNGYRRAASPPAGDPYR